MRKSTKLAAITAGIVAGLTIAGVASAGRDSSGTFSFGATPGGYPYAPGVINRSGVNANMSEVVTALTDSLSRSGSGGMLAPLRVTDGTVGIPTLSFTSDTDSGFYRIGANEIGLSTGGTLRLSHNTLGLTETGWVQVAGTITGAGYSGGPISGTTGAFSSDLSGAVITASTAFRANGGTASAPGISFRDDTNTGFYLADADSFRAVVGGSAYVGITASQTSFAHTVAVETGNLVLSQGADQQISKQTSGKLILGTGHAADVEIHRNGSAAVTVGATSVDMGSRKLTSVTDPTLAQDAATKAYVDAYTATASSATAGTGWTISTNSVRKRSGVATVHMVALAGASGGWSSIATLPADYRPGETFVTWGRCYDGSTSFVCEVNIDANGVVSAVRYDNGTSLVSMWTLGSDDAVTFTFTFLVG